MVFACEPLRDERVGNVDAVYAYISKGAIIPVQSLPLNFNFAVEKHVLQCFFSDARGQGLFPASRALAIDAHSRASSAGSDVEGMALNLSWPLKLSPG